jgi:hypothetical protein
MQIASAPLEGVLAIATSMFSMPLVAIISFLGDGLQENLVSCEEAVTEVQS